jgi:hypothetical protein
MVHLENGGYYFFVVYKDKYIMEHFLRTFRVNIFDPSKCPLKLLH